MIAAFKNKISFWFATGLLDFQFLKSKPLSLIQPDCSEYAWWETMKLWRSQKAFISTLDFDTNLGLKWFGFELVGDSEKKKKL